MGRCASVLIPLCDSRFPELALSGNTEFVLSERTVQAPEVVLLDQRTLATAERYRDALRCAPDLAVEIVSPHETSANVDDKVGNYLDAGTKTVWVLWPRRRHALAYHVAAFAPPCEAPPVSHPGSVWKFGAVAPERRVLSSAGRSCAFAHAFRKSNGGGHRAVMFGANVLTNFNRRMQGAGCGRI